MIPPILLSFRVDFYLVVLAFLVFSCVKEEIDPELHKEKVIQKDYCNKGREGLKYGEFYDLETYRVRQKRAFFIYLFFKCCCVVTKHAQLFCSPMDYSPPGSNVHGISQAIIIECVAIPFSRGSS